jgi:hypothetical protein
MVNLLWLLILFAVGNGCKRFQVEISAKSADPSVHWMLPHPKVSKFALIASLTEVRNTTALPDYR